VRCGGDASSFSGERRIGTNLATPSQVKLGGGHTWQIDADKGQRCILVTIEKKNLHEKWLAIEGDDFEATASDVTMSDPPSSSAPAARELPPAATGQKKEAACSGPETKAAQEELATVETQLHDVQMQMASLRSREEALKARQQALRDKLGSS